MNKLIIFVFFILFSSNSISQTKLRNFVLANGIVESRCSSYQVRGTISETIDEVSNSNLRMKIGFWYLIPYVENVLTPEPTRQSKDIKVFKISKSSISIRWTKGNGENRAVVASDINLDSDNYVADGTNYTAGGFGVNQANTPDSYVVYNGNSNTCEITNLQRNTLYYFRVYEYNGTGNSTNYLTTSERANPNNRMTLHKDIPDWEEAVVGYSLNVYPNPAKDNINLELNLPFEGGEMIIVDNEGREVYKSNEIKNLLNLDVSNFVNGTYHILISNGDEAIYNSFVIER